MYGLKSVGAADVARALLSVSYQYSGSSMYNTRVYDLRLPCKEVFLLFIFALQHIDFQIISASVS